MIHFIHTADIHFGVENYGKIDQKTGFHTRLLDFHSALQHCITYAIDHKVDFFLFCGDAYKTASPTPTQQKLLLSNFLQLYQAQIPVVIIVGNHDHPLSFGKVNSLDIFSDLPIQGFHVIHKPACITIATQNGPVQIVGIPWPTKSNYTLANQTLTTQQITEQLVSSVSSIINSFAQELDPTIPSVLAGHLTVSSGVFSGSEKRAIYGPDPTFLPSQLAVAPFNYVALGHLHRHQIINPGGHPPIVYAGSIERLDFGERREEKGFCEVFIEKHETKVDFITLKTRQFIQLDIVFEDSTVKQTEYIISKIKEQNVENAIIKISYQLKPGQKDLVDLKEIQQACSEAHYVAGIHAVRPVEQRERRSNQVKLDMSIEPLLQEYFKQKAIAPEKAKQLIDKIMQLKQETEIGNN